MLPELKTVGQAHPGTRVVGTVGLLLTGVGVFLDIVWGASYRQATKAAGDAAKMPLTAWLDKPFKREA